ncbi:MAG TPA: arginine-tRNA-protein transferase, partial [Spirochaetia bacterium]|nr:arginine-tRNA-protein transferase [Spirochaetia bacterium]
MSIRGYLLGESSMACPYISGNSATNEQLVIESLDDSDLEGLLASGYRHFGNYFFRPVCSLCHKCLPLRIPVADYRASSSARRTLGRSARFLVTLERPHPTSEAHALYLKHKKRFAEPPGGPSEESYDDFVGTFFHPFPFAYQLSIFDGKR